MLRAGVPGIVASPTGLAAAAASAVLVLGWRGADWPAQLYRIGLCDRDGFALWNSHWYGGHPTLTYSVLYPMVAALLSPGVLAVVSAASSTLCFQHLLRLQFRAQGVRVPASWFAVATVAHVAVGRLTFLFGVTFGLAALVAALHRRHGLALAGSAAAALTSPVAAVCLVIAWGAWAVTSRRVWPCALAGAAAAPVLLLAVAFPSDGVFPFGAAAAAWALTSTLVAWALVPSRQRELRAGLLLYAGAVLVIFAVPTPLGANLTRLGATFLAPVLWCAASRRGRLVVLLLGALTWVQWSPAIDAVARAGQDPSAHEEYHRPLVDELLRRGAASARVEIPFTRRHWEAHHVAAAVPLARGWERQLDIVRNPQFYEPGLTAADYGAWLRENGIRFVALADAPLDPSAEEEAALLRRGLPFLRPVWANAHWQLWEVVGSPALVVGPAVVVAQHADEVVLDVREPGPVEVRVRWSSHWSVPGPACAEETAAGWTRLEGVNHGRVVLRHVVARTLPGGGPNLCVGQ